MILRHLSITNFKNFEEARLEFSPKVNCFLGNNGMGKSNLLDAIYYLSFCKSFTGMTDSMVMRRGEDFTILKGNYLRRGAEEELVLGMSRGKRKSLKRGGKEYDRLSSHIGAFPLVIAAPIDIDLIRGAGDERRRLMDMVISQSDPVYLDNLLRYNRALEQRNRLLRDHSVDHNLYMAVELQMDMAATYLHNARSRWVETLTEIFNTFYHAIAGEGENVTLRYISTLSSPGTSMTSLLDSARRHDEIVGHTSVGPHRDDIEMLIDDMPMRRAGSQGQCKTYSLALRLAQYEFLRSSCGMMPLLLLDDIFDKLDATRVERIMELVTQSDFGQIFITDTNRTHLDDIMSRTTGDYKLWLVSHGTVEPINNHETH